MTKLLGSLRTTVRERYALLAPESFVSSMLPGWSDANCVVQISPALGANFCQTLVTMAPETIGRGHTGENELFAYLIDGRCEVSFAPNPNKLAAGSYIYL